MNRIFHWVVLAAAVAALASCGLPGALIRSASNLAESAGGLVAPAAAAASAF